jgi:hypothetical protein
MMGLIFFYPEIIKMAIPFTFFVMIPGSYIIGRCQRLGLARQAARIV